jgi:conjugal transfer/entry exclusion protein
MNRSRLAAVLFLFVVLFVAIANAQSPPPIIVQPANSSASTSTSSKAAAAVAPDVQSALEAIKLLEEIKAANAEILAKQKAALEKLDELKDAADQLRIFAKRG